ncbi:MAG TPA: hypothetical protein VFL27_09990 [Candidatus Dormibacteraeota bacterium]|nr:hypothetical protein [Candidatus Dormibacteraeota bacterium]
MGSYMNEDVMWERLKDIQLEVENSRLVEPRLMPMIWRSAQLLGERAWLLAGLAARRAPRRRIA